MATKEKLKGTGAVKPAPVLPKKKYYVVSVDGVNYKYEVEEEANLFFQKMQIFNDKKVTLKVKYL